MVAGDFVFAEDPSSGKKTLKRVVAAYRRKTNHLRIVYVIGSDGSKQIIKTTEEHPFWVEGQGWVDAGKLKPGQRLRQANGDSSVVRRTVYEPHPEGVDVFNIQVEGFHTYFVVANGSIGLPILVHNTCVDDFQRLRRARQLANQIGANRMFNMTNDELTLVSRVLDERPNLQIYRTNQRGLLGDFLLIDRSNPRSPMAFLVEIKASGRGAGNQLSNAEDVLQVFGDIKHLEKVSGNIDDIMREISRGRAAFPQPR